MRGKKYTELFYMQINYWNGTIKYIGREQNLF